jgi:NAD(P)-dependent dehydrogenase (short-subunit alcohol dehydrogenase family)
VREHPPELFDRVIDANLRSTFLLTRGLLTHMEPGGHLFFLSSTAGLKGVAHAVAAEVEADGIGVHLITPGPVRTEILDTASHDDLWLLEPADVASAVAWIDSLPPRVVVREIIMRSAMKGPFAPQPLPAERL